MSYPPGQNQYRPPAYQHSYTPAPPPWQPPPPPVKKRGPLRWIIGILAAALAVFVGLAVLGAALDQGNDGAPPASGPSAPAAAKKPTAPAATDFKISAKVTEKTCYGKAGCAVTWLPVVTYTGPSIPAGQTYVVSYQVSGVESGTKVGKVLITSAGPAKQNEKRNRTASDASKIILKVTSVEKA